MEICKLKKEFWRISQSNILGRTLTNDYIEELGYKNLNLIYQNSHIKFL